MTSLSREEKMLLPYGDRYTYNDAALGDNFQVRVSFGVVGIDTTTRFHTNTDISVLMAPQAADWTNQSVDM